MKKRTVLSTLCLATVIISSVVPTVYAVETPSGDKVESPADSVPAGTNQETNRLSEEPIIPEAPPSDPKNATETPQEDPVLNPEKEKQEQIEVPSKVVANPTENQTENEPVNEVSEETSVENVLESGIIGPDTMENRVQWRIVIENNEKVIHFSEGTLPNGTGPIKSLSGLPLSSIFEGTNQVTDIKRVVFDGKVTAGDSLSGLFTGYKELKEIDNLSYLDTNNVTTMSSMFFDCWNLINVDLSTFNTSNTTTMARMFHGCKSLTNIDISTLDTSNVTNMSSMFSECENLTSLDLSTFRTPKLKRMDYMFSRCINIVSINLKGLDTSIVNQMQLLFNGCTKLDSLDLSGFNTSNVTSMSHMFGGCESLTSLDLSGFNTELCTTMNGMFSNCQSLTELNLLNFDTSKVTIFRDMFANCTNLTSLDLSHFDMTSIAPAYFGPIFIGDSKLTHLKLGETAALYDLPPVTLETGDYWRRDGAGIGYTNQELITNYNDAKTTMAGDWYWVPSMTLKESEIYLEDRWNLVDNLVSLIDKQGDEIPRDHLTDILAVTITKNLPELDEIVASIDTSTSNKYTVEYTYHRDQDTDISRTTTVTVSQLPTYSLQLPSRIQFTKGNEPVNGSSIGTAVNYSVKLVNRKDDQPYTGDKNIIITVASTNGWQLKETPEAKEGTTYQLTDPNQPTIETKAKEYSFTLNKGTNEQVFNANLTDKATKSGDYWDTLTFSYEKKP